MVKYSFRIIASSKRLDGMQIDIADLDVEASSDTEASIIVKSTNFKKQIKNILDQIDKSNYNSNLIYQLICLDDGRTVYTKKDSF